MLSVIEFALFLSFFNNTSEYEFQRFIQLHKLYEKFPEDMLEEFAKAQFDNYMMRDIEFYFELFQKNKKIIHEKFFMIKIQEKKDQEKLQNVDPSNLKTSQQISINFGKNLYLYLQPFIVMRNISIFVKGQG
mmetsp:Transcript_19078/g.18210  ORF Transcript_19078/g.18210 Transcript_19078/m.18210 type:complete len:132 (+) Transcript_19078:378-773(+)